MNWKNGCEVGTSLKVACEGAGETWYLQPSRAPPSCRLPSITAPGNTTSSRYWVASLSTVGGPERPTVEEPQPSVLAIEARGAGSQLPSSSQEYRFIVRA